MTAAPRAPWAATSLRRRVTEPDPVTPEVRATVRHRAGGRCELFCGNPGVHVHHRKLRRHGDHSVSCLVLVCDSCHRRIHGNGSTWAHASGWLVRSHQDTAATPLAYDGRWVLLTADGGLEDVKEPAS